MSTFALSDVQTFERSVAHTALSFKSAIFRQTNPPWTLVVHATKVQAAPSLLHNVARCAGTPHKRSCSPIAAQRTPPEEKVTEIPAY
ncbi:hypothetical protein PM082_024236 [Marasmius tenuissimus]|nr:hypothetical protein PM082_024236 [Marasmius tenuissimus]